MAITHSLDIRNQLATVIADAVDLGSAALAGRIVIKQSTTVLAEIPLQNPAFGLAASGVITANGMPAEDSNADASGVADNFTVVDRDGNEIFSGSVGGLGSGADAEISSTTITAGDAVRINSLTYASPL